VSRNAPDETSTMIGGLSKERWRLSPSIRRNSLRSLAPYESVLRAFAADYWIMPVVVTE
jgi:hypothetical protein